MMDTTVPSADMDFSTFVLDLNQSPKLDCASGGTGHGSATRCCPPESRLSAEFENKMQKLITNFDLDDLDGCDMGLPPVRFCDPEPGEPDGGTIQVDRDYPIESLDTTVDNEDDPLNLTGEDCDSGDAGSSDEQQQESRSLSLSYSLSISHAQENFSQYSQSTGLSKRYDSPCSYEDDRESECTNFDKLDDWSDLINDLHNNNNNNADVANREFKEYLDDFRGKDQTGSSTSGVETSEEGTNDTKEQEGETTEAGKRNCSVERSKAVEDSRPDTPALERREKCHNYLDYRDPGVADFDDDPMLMRDGGASIDDNSNVVVPMTACWESEGAGALRQQSSSGKRKLCEDYEDRERQLELIVEKFQKTDIVPDHGQHASLVEDASFARWNQTSVAGPCMEDENQTDDEKLVMLDGEEEEEEDSAVATTPTNPRNVQRLFRTMGNEEAKGLQQAEEDFGLVASGSDSQLLMKQRLMKKVAAKADAMAQQPVAGSSRKSLKLPLN